MQETAAHKLHDRPLGGKKRPPNDKQNSGRAYVSKSAGTFQPFGYIRNQSDPSPTTLGAIALSDIP